MKPKALVLQAYGSNRDFDVIEALTLAGAHAVGIPLNELRINKTLLASFQLLVLPGGFSYADALGAGKLLALDLVPSLDRRRAAPGREQEEQEPRHHCFPAGCAARRAASARAKAAR